MMDEASSLSSGCRAFGSLRKIIATVHHHGIPGAKRLPDRDSGAPLVGSLSRSHEYRPRRAVEAGDGRIDRAVRLRIDRQRTGGAGARPHRAASPRRDGACGSFHRRLILWRQDQPRLPRRLGSPRHDRLRLCVGSAVCHPMDARPHRLTWFHGGQASTERYSRRPAQTPAAGTAPGHGPPGFALPEKRGGLLGGKGS